MTEKKRISILKYAFLIFKIPSENSRLFNCRDESALDLISGLLNPVVIMSYQF